MYTFGAKKDLECLTDAERIKWGTWLFAWITQSEQGFVDQYQKDVSGIELDEYVEGSSPYTSQQRRQSLLATHSELVRSGLL